MSFDMKLGQFLSQKKTTLVTQWLHLIFESYPPETAGFLKREKNRFDNPVAYQISRGVKGLFDELLLPEMDADRALAFLDEIIMIRAVQDFSPSQALAFIFLLKSIIRKELADELQDRSLAEEVWQLEARIDGLALLAFEAYVKRRERIYELRVNEVKNRVSGLLRRTGLNLNNF
jgi:hypothetical protein